MGALSARLLLLIAAAGIGLVGAAADHGTRNRFGAVPMAQDDEEQNFLVPRYFRDASLPELAKRDGNCADGKHPCHDVERGDQCCSNTQYCYIDVKDDLRCCPIGADCANNQKGCGENEWNCYRGVTSTITTTTTAAPSRTRSSQSDSENDDDDQDSVMTMTTTTVETKRGCCNRPCSTSSYLCPKDRGNVCCPFGTECQAGGNCVRRIESSREPRVKPVPEGCLTSQFRCDDGDGCCNEGRVCTRISDQAYCAAGPPTASGVSIINEGGGGGGDGDGGLSEGAKAGVAIGAVFGAGLIIAALTWVCIRRRRSARTLRGEQSVTAQSGGGGGGGGGINMAETPNMSNQPPADGLTRDYFGPDAAVGPYTFTETVASTTAATSPNPEHPYNQQQYQQYQQYHQYHNGAGVSDHRHQRSLSHSMPGSPVESTGPGAAAAAAVAPVEMDSRAQSPETTRTESFYATPMSPGRYELAGSGLPPGSAGPYIDDDDDGRPLAGQRSPSLQNTPPAMTPRDELPGDMPHR